MSMHKIPLTELERKGLELHRLPIGTPSQLSDCFRAGMSWALSQKGGFPIGEITVIAAGSNVGRSSFDPK